MFKKDQPEQILPQREHETKAPPARRHTPPSGGASAVIGASITIKGDVSGDEDLVILGKVQGTVNLAKHNVTVGPSGRIKADVRGKMVIVEGEVEGDLKAQEQIVLRHTARVEGSISAPRVALEDGAVFRGGIEMDSAANTAGNEVPAKKVAAGGNGRGKDPEAAAGAKGSPTPNATGEGLPA